jgi:hypothetical protein
MDTPRKEAEVGDVVMVDRDALDGAPQKRQLFSMNIVVKAPEAATPLHWARDLKGAEESSSSTSVPPPPRVDVCFFGACQVRTQDLGYQSGALMTCALHAWCFQVTIKNTAI